MTRPARPPKAPARVHDTGRDSTQPGSPAARFGQDPFDDIVADFLRPHVFDGGHRIAALLERNPEIDDVTLARVASLVGHQIAIGEVEGILIHRNPDFDG
jgi:hypothetical protein